MGMRLVGSRRRVAIVERHAHYITEARWYRESDPGEAARMLDMAALTRLSLLSAWKYEQSVVGRSVPEHERTCGCRACYAAFWDADYEGPRAPQPMSYEAWAKVRLVWRAAEIARAAQ